MPSTTIIAQPAVMMPAYNPINPVEGWEWYNESPIEESFIEDAVIVEDLNSL